MNEEIKTLESVDNAKDKRSRLTREQKKPKAGANGERPRLSKAERDARRQARIERNVKLAQEPDVQVIRVADPGANTMATILRFFAPAFDEMKNRLGMPGNRGVDFEAGIPLVKRAVQLCAEFSCLTADVNKMVHYEYYPPRELVDLLPEEYKPKKGSSHKSVHERRSR